MALGGVAPIPWRASEAESALLGEAPERDVVARAAGAALATVQPLEHNGYKITLARNLLLRALEQATH